MEGPKKAPSRRKRGRSREEEEAKLSEEERKKRQKNRDAAMKCRQNKKLEVEKLKESNSNLEKDNEELINRKSNLEKVIKELMSFIEEHIRKGCEIPKEECEWYFQNCGKIQEMLNPNLLTTNQEELNQAQPSIQYNTTVTGQTAEPIVGSPSSPSSASLYCSPVTLFTAQPIQGGCKVVQIPQEARRSVCQPSPSQSPSVPLAYTPSQSPSVPMTYTPSPQPMDSSVIGEAVGYLATPGYTPPSYPYSSQLSQAQGCHPMNQLPPQMETQTSTDSCATIPSVVYEEEGMDSPSQHLHQAQSPGTPFTARQGDRTPNTPVAVNNPKYESFDNNAIAAYTTSIVINGNTNGLNNNLGSGGFTLQQDSNQDVPQTVPSLPQEPTSSNEESNKECRTVTIKCEDPDQLNVTGPELLAQAILSIPEDQMSSSLRQQIHTLRSSSSASTSSSHSEARNPQFVNQPSQSNFGSCHNSSTHISQQPYYQLITSRYSGHTQSQEHQMEQRTNVPQASESPQEPSLASQDESTNTGRSVLRLRGVSTKYVEKKGHKFLLDQQANGKYRVYEIHENHLVDTEYELQLEETASSPATPSPMSSSAQVVPEEIQTQNDGTDQESSSPQTTSDSTEEQNESLPPPSLTLSMSSLAEKTSQGPLMSMNLPSLSFNDLNRDDYDVFAKKPRTQSS